VVCLIGSYALRNSLGDSVVTVIFGILGYEMRKFGYSRIALILGLLLGNMAETALRQALMTRAGLAGFVTRPISLVLVVLTLALVVAPLWKAYRRRRGNVVVED
jgi:putative tricarboxylic transport membrane protein